MPEWELLKATDGGESERVESSGWIEPIRNGQKHRQKNSPSVVGLRRAKSISEDMEETDSIYPFVYCVATKN
jgi:hypothetical protein